MGRRSFSGPGAGRAWRGRRTIVASLGLDPAYPLAILLAVTEFAGGLMLIAGGGTRWASLALAIDMAVAIWKVHYQNGFFLNWTQRRTRATASRYSLVLIGGLVALMLGGPGALSVDEWRHSIAEARARGRARSMKL